MIVVYKYFLYVIRVWSQSFSGESHIGCRHGCARRQIEIQDSFQHYDSRMADGIKNDRANVRESHDVK